MDDEVGGNEEGDAPVSFLCSSCYTPCSGADAHVIPNWNPSMEMIVTTYRCNNCWLKSLAVLRTLVASGEDPIQTSFCDFLARHGYTKDSETIRAAAPERRQTWLLAIINAVEAGALVFDP